MKIGETTHKKYNTNTYVVATIHNSHTQDTQDASD